MSSKKRRNELEEANLRIANAIRLAEDAAVLLKGGRIQGSLTSSIIGGEELGRAIGYIENTEWSKANRSAGHLGRLREWTRLDSWRDVRTGNRTDWKPSLSADVLIKSLDWPPEDLECLRYMMRDTTESAPATPPDGFSVEHAEKLAHRLSNHLIDRAAYKRREKREKTLYSVLKPNAGLDVAARQELDSLVASISFVVSYFEEILTPPSPE